MGKIVKDSIIVKLHAYVRRATQRSTGIVGIHDAAWKGYYFRF